MKQIYTIQNVILFLIAVRATDKAYPIANGSVNIKLQSRETKAKFDESIKQGYVKISALIHDLNEWFKYEDFTLQSRKDAIALHYYQGELGMSDSYDGLAKFMRVCMSDLRISADTHVIHIYPVEPSSDTLINLHVDIVPREQFAGESFIHRKTNIGDFICNMSPITHKGGAFDGVKLDKAPTHYKFHSLSFMHGEGDDSTVDNTTIVTEELINGDSKTLTIWLVDGSTPVAIYHNTGIGWSWNFGELVVSEAMMSELQGTCAHYLNALKIISAKPVLFSLKNVEGAQDILNAIDKTRVIDVAIVEIPEGEAGVVTNKYINYKIMKGEVSIVGIRQATPGQAALFGSEKLNVTGYSKKVNPLGGRGVVAQHYIPTVCADKDRYLCTIPFYVESVALTFVG